MGTDENPVTGNSDHSNMGGIMRAIVTALFVFAFSIIACAAYADEAEVAAGRQVFNHCIACHAIDPGKLGFGPDLHGVVGRAAGSLPNFQYSPALQKSEFIWTEANLRRWVSGNDKMIPGTRMRHIAITDPAEQTYLITFLKSLEAPPRDFAKEAEVLLTRAVDKLNADGPDAAFAAFNQHKGDFVYGELYVFVFDMKGKYMASGANPKLAGQNAIDLKDAEGKYIVRSMIDMAKKDGSGIIDYVWLNRADNHVENKRSIIRRSGDYIVGVGYYLK